MNEEVQLKFGLVSKKDLQNMPNILVETTIRFSGSLSSETDFLIQACKGDHPDRFGHLNYWKCMLALMPFILKNEINMANVNMK